MSHPTLQPSNSPTSKKRIVLIGPAYPYRGGQSLVEAHLWHTLTEAGHDVRTITFTTLYPKIFFPGTTQYDDSGTIFYDHRDRIERIISSVNPLTWVRAARRLRDLQPDLILFVWWMPFFGPCYSTIARLAKRWTKARIGFLVENYISHENRWFDKYWSRVTLDRADGFICQSGFVKQQIKAVHDQPVYRTTLSVYDCYDLGKHTTRTARESFGLPESAPVVLFFGLIRPYKGLERLIAAFPEIVEAFPDAQLLIAGEAYEDASKYEQQIDALDLGDRTTFDNKFIPNEDIERYFKATNVVCLPYHSASQSGILMMAYGFRKPVIVTDVGGLRELIQEGKTGAVMPDNQPETVARTVIEVLQSGIDYAAHIDGLAESLGYRSLGEIVDRLT